MFGCNIRIYCSGVVVGFVVRVYRVRALCICSVRVSFHGILSCVLSCVVFGCIVRVYWT